MRATIAAIVAIALTASAAAARPPALGTGAQAALDAAPGAPRLWATVNVCDTPGHPDAIGLRGSMPGGGTLRAQLFMRFQVQYHVPGTTRWRAIGPDGDSGFIAVGAAKRGTRQGGVTFRLTSPDLGEASHLLRGLVTFEWRHRGVTLRRAVRRTTAGHPGTAGADPVGYSAATCQVV